MYNPQSPQTIFILQQLEKHIHEKLFGIRLDRPQGGVLIGSLNDAKVTIFNGGGKCKLIRNKIS